MRYTVVLFIIVLSQPGICTGQPFTTFNYSMEEGLPSSEVYQVYQDKEGFIWFATDNGIVKYDGNEMQTFHVSDSLSDPVVFGFQEDDSGRVWFKSYTGKLSYYENGKIKKYKYNNKIGEIAEIGIPSFTYSTRDKELRILSKKTLAWIDSTGNIKSQKFEEEGLYYFGSIENGVAGLSTVMLKNYPIFINGKRYTTELSPEPYDLSTYGVPSRSVEWRGNLYLSIKNNVFCYNGKTVSRVYAGKAPIVSFSRDRADNLWIGYMNNGGEGFSDSNFVNPIDLPILKELSITSYLEDNYKGIWISTLENGVYYIPNNQVKNYIPPKKSKTTQVITVGDSILKSSQKGEFTIIDSRLNKVLWDTTLNSPILNFHVTKNKNIFLYADSTYVYDSMMRHKITILFAGLDYVDEDHGIVWMYGNATVGKFNEDGTEIFKKRIMEIYRSFILHDSNFFMAGKTGLQIRSKNLTLLKTPDEFADFKITQFLSINDTSLLMNTLGSGLLLLNTKTWKHQKFNTESNFLANNIYISILNKNFLWLGTEVGIIRMSLNSLLDGKPQYQRLDSQGGLVSNDIKFLAITSSKVWAFSDNGYSVIPINQFDSAPPLPKPYLKSLIINDSLYKSYPKNIYLSHTNTNMVVKIGYLSFTNQEITSRYRLSKDVGWTTTNERTIPFNSLAPNSYSFELEYSIDNVNWIPTDIRLNFIVTPPWWQLWYVQVCVVLFTVLGIFAYSRKQIRNYKQKNHYLNVINIQQQKLVKAEVQITERERKRIAKELHDGVGTDLVLVKLKVMELLSKNGNRESTKGIDEHFNETIQEIRNISYGLTPPDLDRFGLKKTLSNYINKLSISVDTVIHFDFDGEVQKGEVEISIFRVMQELINNTLKHARAKNIIINIQASPEVISISYIDDGIGFSYNKINHGLGLANIESRIQSIGGRINFESNHTGTTYLIHIPIEQYSIK